MVGGQHIHDVDVVGAGLAALVADPTLAAAVAEGAVAG
jgi:hypothetical protein